MNTLVRLAVSESTWNRTLLKSFLNPGNACLLLLYAYVLIFR